MSLAFPRAACAERLKAGLAEIDLVLDETTQARLLDYLALMDKWNQAYNLTAIRKPLEMVDKHLLDSLSLLPHVQDAPLLDVGAGAGLPGLVLAIATPLLIRHEYMLNCRSGLAREKPRATAFAGKPAPTINSCSIPAGSITYPQPFSARGEGSFSVTLVDAVAKKVQFMQHVIRTLQLPNARAIHSRIEDLTGQYPQITSRAFSSLADFVSLTRPLLSPGGTWLAMKGQIPQDELHTLPAWVKVTATPALCVPAALGERHLILLTDQDTP